MKNLLKLSIQHTTKNLQTSNKKNTNDYIHEILVKEGVKKVNRDVLVTMVCFKRLEDSNNEVYERFVNEKQTPEDESIFNQERITAKNSVDQSLSMGGQGYNNSRSEYSNEYKLVKHSNRDIEIIKK